MLWWVQWLRDAIGALLFTLGLQNKKATIVLVGLDNAGKTTLLHRLASGGLSSFPPTEKPHADRFALGGVSFRAWDLGGHDSVRHLWDDFLPDAHGVVFLVERTVVFLETPKSAALLHHEEFVCINLSIKFSLKSS